MNYWIMLSNASQTEFARALRDNPTHPGACHDNFNTLFTSYGGIDTSGVEFIDLGDISLGDAFDDSESVDLDTMEQRDGLLQLKRIFVITATLKSNGDQVLRGPDYLWNELYKSAQFRIWKMDYSGVDEGSFDETLFSSDKEKLGLAPSLTPLESHHEIVNVIMRAALEHNWI